MIFMWKINDFLKKNYINKRIVLYKIDNILKTLSRIDILNKYTKR